MSFVERTRMFMLADETAPINLATWGGSSKIDGITFDKVHVDGGVSHAIIDVQNGSEGGYIHNIRFENCTAGGHTPPEYGRYRFLQLDSDMPVVETIEEQALNPKSIYFPTLNSEANHWRGCEDLIPNRAGQVIIP
jgi:hypothetical protein